MEERSESKMADDESSGGMKHIESRSHEEEEELERLVSPKTAHEDRTYVTLRPKTLEEYVGQEKIKQRLQIALDAAKIRKEPLDHVLLAGPPGLGKTTLAYVIGNEMDTSVHVTSGPVIEKQGDLAAILTNIEPGEVLFIDEIHRLNRSIEEVLYSAMEDYSLDILIGKGPSARSIRIDINHFTLIGATTRSGLLTSPLRNRFGMIFDLDFYTSSELLKIVQRSAHLLQMGISEEAAQVTAERARGTPRIANRLLKRIRDFATVKNKTQIDLHDTHEALESLEIDSFGLDYMDRKILRIIIEHYKGGPAGIRAIAAAAGIEPDTISEVYEPFLIQTGFLTRSHRGRNATLKSYQHLGYDVDQTNPQVPMF